jgi:methyl-accepting chemotaxis protein
MRKSIPYIALGKVMMILAVAGMVFSLAGITGTWILRPRIKDNLSTTLEIFHSSLLTTSDTVEVLSSVIDNAKDDLGLIQSSLDSLGASIKGISTSLDTSSDLIGDDLRLTVIETQVALSSAATSAEIIDNTLAFLASIPLLGADYQPEVPLHISLTQVAASLDEVPDSLESLENNLDTTSSDLQTFSDDLALLSKNLGVFNEDLSDTNSILEDYDSIISDALTRLESLQSHLVAYTIFTSLILSGVLLWLGIAQVNVYLRGYDYVHHEEKTISLSDLTRE